MPSSQFPMRGARFPPAAAEFATPGGAYCFNSLAKKVNAATASFELRTTFQLLSKIRAPKDNRTGVNSEMTGLPFAPRMTKPYIGFLGSWTFFALAITSFHVLGADTRSLRY